MNDTHVIAAFGDWHGDVQWGRLAINSAKREGIRTILHIGDWGVDWPGPKRGLQDTRLNKALAANDQVFVLSPGNHDCLVNINRLPVDDDGLITWRSNIKILPKGGRTIIGGLTIGGLGGAYSVDRQFRTEGRDLWSSEEEPTIDEAKRLIAGGRVDLLLSHDVPMGIQVTPEFDLPDDVRERADRTRHLLSEVVREVRPANVVSGHHHQRVVGRIVHPGEGSTRVDELGKEGDRLGNGIVLRSGSSGLQIEPLHIRGTP
jgi:predicted phosphodiesterase